MTSSTENVTPASPEASSTVCDHTPSFLDLGLSEPVLAAVSDLGYESPSPVQVQSIPAVLEGRDLLAAAQTGTGKTAAFLLPTMSKLSHVAFHHGPTMLVVTPTRELAQQIENVCATIEGRTHHSSVTVVGGVGYEPQKAALRRGCDILVATPGRLVDLIEQGVADLSEVSVLVIDEADRMLDMGFLPAMHKIVSRTSSSRQTLLFSATLDKGAISGVRDLVRDPVIVEIAHKGTVADTIDQYALPVSLEAKNTLLAQVLEAEGPQRVIVFTRTKHRADACCRRLRRSGISCAPIHGNRSQNQRERALANFRSGTCDVLVATDVLARGIDVSDVRYVVNFDVPADPEDYIHRIGRTGRAGETGWALTFVTVADRDDLFAIERLMGKVVPAYEPRRPLDLGEEPPELDPNRSAEPASHGGAARGSRGKHGGRRGRGVSQGRARGASDSGELGSDNEGRRRNSRRSTGTRGRGDAQPRRQQKARSKQTRNAAATTWGKGKASASARGKKRAAIDSQTPATPSRPSNDHRRHPGDQQGRARGIN